MQKVNKALLTQEQAAIHDEWEKFFASPGWKLYQNYFGRRIGYAQNRILTIQGEQELGSLQGGLEVLIDLLIRAEDLVGGEFLTQTGELDEPVEPEPVTGPTDWNA